MIFPHSFYEDEIRCDFLIPSMVKRTWAAQLQILADLDEACQRSGIEYFAEWGTLLGAVRHGGFIPWDDDLDICMKRHDYEKFVSNVSSYLPDNYSIVNYRTNRDFKQFLSRVVSSDHYRFDPGYMKKYSGLPFALGLDIFPLDFLTDDEEYEREREEKARLVFSAVNELAYYDTPVSRLSDTFDKIEKKLKVVIDRKGDVLTQLRDILTGLYGEVSEEDAVYVTMYPLWMDRKTFRFPIGYYRRGIRVGFENTTIPVPTGYSDVLSVKYGSNYMTPIRSGGAHEYPYFEAHVDVLREHFGYEWPAYRFNENDLKSRSPEYEKKTACLYVTYGLREFNNMRDLAGRHLDEGYTVTILPISRFEIEPDMSGINENREEFPDEMYLEGLDGATVSHDPAVADTHFDIIVTNYQYDEYNLITTVDKKFYSKALREKCDMLIYVPAWEVSSIRPEDERAIKLMPSYVNTPMAAVCDMIILHGQEMKDRYVECLTAFSGSKYRDLWEKKITVTDSKRTARKKSADKKKSIMFYVGLSLFAVYGDKASEKIKKCFDIFDENKDKVDVVFWMQDGLEENLRQLDPDLYEKFAAYDFRESATSIDTDDIDAYYGEPSEFATYFANEGKPVMIMTV